MTELAIIREQLGRSVQHESSAVIVIFWITVNKRPVHLTHSQKVCQTGTVQPNLKFWTRAKICQRSSELLKTNPKDIMITAGHHILHATLHRNLDLDLSSHQNGERKTFLAGNRKPVKYHRWLSGVYDSPWIFLFLFFFWTVFASVHTLGSDT